MINNVTLTGRLTRDPELAYTNYGTAYARFSLAVNRAFKNNNGEHEADFINCTVWGKSAENFAGTLSKGSLIGVVGNIQTSSYEKNGQRIFQTQVVVRQYSYLESKNSSNQNNASNNSQGNNEYSKKNNQDPFANNGNSIDITDDDLPFD